MRRFDATFDNPLHSKNYVNIQSQKTLYRDQSYLVTFGQYGRFKAQVRYDEIPHIYSSTVRTLFTETAPGVWSFPAQIRSILQTTSAANLPSLMAGTGTNASNGVVTNFNFLIPSTIHKAGTALLSYDVTPALNIAGSFWRESQNGLRPIGLILNSSPSASATSGYGVELPETISYFNNLAKIGAEYGKGNWALQMGYTGSFFENNIAHMVFDNPFNLNAIGASTPLTGQMSLYPSNHAHHLTLAGATDFGKWLRFTAAITPGWLRQNDLFAPYTTNHAITGCGDGSGGKQSCTVAPSGVTSLHGDKQTLAMNYSLVTLLWKNLQMKAGYRHYDYNNNTRVHECPACFTPVQGDVGSPSPEGTEGRATSYNTKDVEFTVNWYFARKSSMKTGYEGEWIDRSQRDVSHSLENSFVAAVDVGYWQDWLMRVSYRHADRRPDAYQDETVSTASGVPVSCSDNTTTFFTTEQRCNRRFDEAGRIRDRADGLVEYEATDKISLSVFGGLLQDDYNRRGMGGDSPVPLNFLTGTNQTTHPYYLYGILKDISYNYGFGSDFAVTRDVSLFAEYSHEHYYRRMISRSRTPPSPSSADILTCTNGCDTANNDWESTTPEPVDIWTVGADTHIGKRALFTTYYTLSAGKAVTDSRYLGVNGIIPTNNLNSPGVDCSNTAARQAACKFTLVGTSAAVSYPPSLNRQHEVVAIFKYKLNEHLWPKVEYRYQQFDNKDFQTSYMTQYMGCVSGAGTPNSVAGCPVAMINSSTSATPVLSPNGQPTRFYPGFVVGDTSAARYMFLGADQPSYHAHYLAATLEFHF
jgi:MtrB/PioB family decaheme-associated outer membrane protein